LEDPTEVTTDFEYDYNICYLNSSCMDCGIWFHINLGLYQIKNILALCDICYWKIRNEHTKRGIKWNGTKRWERVRENPNFR
jgi:hypothetical protein